MQFSECPFMQLGDTWYGQDRTIDTSDLAAKQLEGREWWFPDTPPGSLINNPSPRTNRGRLMRIVRNNTGVTLYAKQLVKLQLTGTFTAYGQAVDRQCNVDAAMDCYPVDEYLPNGVRNGDLFWICMKGPALVKTSRAGDATNVFSVGDVVVGLTAATTQATTAGRVQPQSGLVGITSNVTATATEVTNAVQGAVGKAMSALTTGQTDADLLVDVRAA